MSFVIARRVNKQVDILIQILDSFSGIDSNIKILISKLESYDKMSRNLGDKNSDIVKSSLKNISDRVEKLENTIGSKLDGLSKDINNLSNDFKNKVERKYN
jgi:gas vesicle protein